ncbi:30S ribosomal protein S1 [Aquicella lusitana]|uniref:30S ribosomal protein S1 n=1 Tax=Aquicella lusitana TaxID=254246 RepID=A0A370GYV0_9COXI|nr:30S ribosomal protein S1 [Aquicella lusitana]RDI48846.1 SSU ribosomal protein S1P [Aquicella lusitana]VVC73274.1 30S ribosomal protein S1 [Aquicella lusitana]
MGDTFAQLFEKSLSETPMLPGAIISATVERIEDKYVVVDAGLKSESYIPIEQFYDESGQLEVKVGDEVKVALEVLEDGFGSTRLSRERAKRLESWSHLEHAYESKETIRGVIVGRVKGGFTVEINKVRAFLPGSLVDVKPIRDPESFEGKEFEFKVIKVDPKRNNIVVSRRAVLEAESNVERAAVLENINEGDEVKGIVKNLTDYGAFIDLGGVDGLLHITDMSWKRIKHPSEILAIGDEIKVKVLKIDRDNVRVSLGLKQLGGDPWQDISHRYPVGSKISGRVTNITDYGCFVEIEEGIEGLVHVSEMDWTNKNVNPNKVVHLGQEVEVMVLDVDADRRRISLGIKQCTSNPWAAFAENHEKSEHVKGKIKSITDFGIFLELEGGIDGLIYLSDIAWSEAEAQETLRKYQKGDELEAVILAIDVERERIALGLKQLAEDPLANYLMENEKGTVVAGKVVEVDQKQAVVELAEGIRGILRASEIAAEKVDDVRTKLQVGDEVEAKIMGTDRKVHAITLSIKAKDGKAPAKKSTKATGKTAASTAAAGKKKKSADTLKTTLGDLFKDHISNGNESEGEDK